jgi:hypothetical protein
MANSVQSWPEYNELHEILQNVATDVQRISKLVWDVYKQSNVINNWKRNMNSLCFVLTCIKFYDMRQYIDQIFQTDKYSELIIWKETVLALFAIQCPWNITQLDQPLRSDLKTGLSEH